MTRSLTLNTFLKVLESNSLNNMLEFLMFTVSVNILTVTASFSLHGMKSNSFSIWNHTYLAVTTLGSAYVERCY